MPAKNFAARAGRWSAAHRKTAIFGWLAFVIVAFMIGGKVGTQTLAEKDLGVGDSGRATKIVDKAFPEVAGEQVFVQSKTEKATDPAFRSAVRDVERRLEANPDVRNVKSPYAKGNPGQLARNGHAALVNFEIAGDVDQAQDKVDAVLATTAAAQKAHPELRIEQFGDASAGKAVRQDVRRRPPQGRDDLAPGHAHHPAVRLRRASSPPACRSCSASPPCSARWASSRASASSRRPPTT